MLSKPSRRNFVLGTTAVAASTMLLNSPLKAAFQQKSPRLQLGIQLYSLRGYPLEEALKHAKAIGFKQVEFYSGMLPIDASAARIA